MTTAITNTIKAPCKVSFAVGHVTLKAFLFYLLYKFYRVFHFLPNSIGRSGGTRTLSLRFWRPALYQLRFTLLYRVYSIILLTPGSTVLPPSRIAKFNFSDIAIGVISFTVNLASSPGITISVPAGNSTSPVTSVVLK